MAEEVSRNLSQINEEVSKIQRNLSAATKESNSLAKSLKADPRNLRLAATYAESLQRKAELARQKVALLVEKQKQLKASGVSETSDQYKKLTTQIVQAQSEADVLNRKIRETGQQKLTNLQNGLSQVSKAAAAILASIIAIGVAFAKAGDDIDKNSKKFNVSAEAYQYWSNIFDKTLQSSGGYVTAMNQMVLLMSQLERGTGKMVTALEVLGISAEELKGKSPQELLEYMLAYLGAIEDEDERIRAAATVFGTAGTDLATIAGLAQSEIDELNAELEKSGIITAEQAANAAALNDAFDDFKNTLKKLIVDMGDSLMPLFKTLISLARTFIPILGGIATFLNIIGPFGQVILFVILGVIAAMPMLIALVKALHATSIALDVSLTSLLAKFFIVFAILMAISALLNAIFGQSYSLDVDTSAVDGLMENARANVATDLGGESSGGTTNVTYNDYSTTNVTAETEVDLDEVIDGLNNKVIQVGGGR